MAGGKIIGIRDLGYFSFKGLQEVIDKKAFLYLEPNLKQLFLKEIERDFFNKQPSGIKKYETASLIGETNFLNLTAMGLPGPQRLLF